jgi:hypothetical protein
MADRSSEARYETAGDVLNGLRANVPRDFAIDRGNTAALLRVRAFGIHDRIRANKLLCAVR